MKLLSFLVLVGLSFMVACGEPPKPPEPLTVTLTSSELNPAFNSSVTFTATATPAGKIVKLELLEGTIVKKTVNNAANLEQSVVMNIAGKRSFVARVTDSAGVVVSSAVVEVNTIAPPLPTVTLTASNLKPVPGSDVTFTVLATPAGGIVKLELLEGTIVTKTVFGADGFEQNILMDAEGTRSFTARVTDTAGVIVNSGVVEVNTQNGAPGSGSVAQMALGSQHTCALLTSGDVRCWGRGIEGQLGLGKKQVIGDVKAITSVPPIRFPIGFKVKQIAAGSSHTCALSETGKVICWGRNEFGQLGYGDITNRGDTPETTPDKIGFVGLPQVQTIISGNNALHTCVILVSRAVKCWGFNNTGQLGLGNTNTIGDSPNELEQTPAIQLGNSLVKQIAVGSNHTCALLNDSSLRCWGSDTFGQLGDGDNDENAFGDELGEIPNTKAVAIADAAQIELGNSHTCVLTTTKQLRCWGSNTVGQLGYGNKIGIGDDELPVTAGFVNVGADVKQLSVNGDSTCVLRTDDKIKCWGLNNDGQLGYGNQIDIGDNEPLTDVGTVQVNSVAIQGKVTRIFSGKNHNCVLFESGNIKCWGDNSSAQLGYGNTNNIGDNEFPSSVGIVPLF